MVVVQQQPASRFDTSCQALTVPGMWGSGLNFGKGDFAFYKSFDQFLKPFAEEDREASRLRMVDGQRYKRCRRPGESSFGVLNSSSNTVGSERHSSRDHDHIHPSPKKRDSILVVERTHTTAITCQKLRPADRRATATTNCQQF